MSCVRAAPTAAPAMRPATRSTVTAAGSTSVGEHDGTAQGSENSKAVALVTVPISLLLFPPTLLPSLPSFGAGDGTQIYSTDFSATELCSPNHAF